MEPTLGRIVRYFLSDVEIHECGPVDAREHPAIITRVHTADCVNLTVFFDRGGPAARPRVMSKTAAKVGMGHWMWPAAPIRKPDDLPGEVHAAIGQIGTVSAALGALPFHAARQRAILLLDEAVGALRESLKV